MAGYVDLLRAIPLFSKLDEGEAARVEELVEVVGVLRGDVLFRKGEPTDSFYVVVRGRVDIVPEGADRIPLGEGEFFGEMGVINSAPRNATAQAAEDTVLLRVAKADFDRILAIDDAIAGKVMEACWERGRRIVEADAEAATPAEVLLFYSPRGGAGTTSLAINVACRLADQTAEPVALLDGDLQFGNCHVLLDALEPSPFGELAAARPSEPLPEDELAQLVQETARGVLLARAPQRTEEADAVTPLHLLGLVDYLGQRARRIVVDTPCVLNDRTLALVDAATAVFLVIEPELVSVQRGVDCVRVLELAGYPRERIHLVLNKVGAGGIPAEEVLKVLKVPVYAEVGHDPEAASEAIHVGKPVVDIDKDSPMAVGVANLCRRQLADRDDVRQAEATEPPRAGFSFWNLLGG